MPRFDADLTQVSAFFTTYPKGTYEFLTGKGKPFLNVDKETGASKNYGVRYSLTDPNDPKKNPQPLTLYWHSDGAQKFTKQVIMALLGYTGDSVGEAKFNADFAGRDWSFATADNEGDEGMIGEVWQLCQEKRVLVDCDISINPDTKNEQQQYKGFHKVG